MAPPGRIKALAAALTILKLPAAQPAHRGHYNWLYVFLAKSQPSVGSSDGKDGKTRPVGWQNVLPPPSRVRQEGKFGFNGESRFQKDPPLALYPFLVISPYRLPLTFVSLRQNYRWKPVATLLHFPL